MTLSIITGGELSLGEKIVANDRAASYNDYIVTTTEQVR